MRTSEFRDALELAFGPVQGDSLARDLYLVRIDATAEEALAAGIPPAKVWDALMEETDADEKTRWIYRRPRRVES